MAVAAGPDTDVASLRAALDAALEANECWERTAAELREALAGRDAEIARQSAELERVSAALAVLQRMVFGDSSERSRPEPPAPQDEGGEPRPAAWAAWAVIRAGRGVRGRGRGGGITRSCPGLRWSGILRAAGTAARSAGRRSRGWAAIMSRSCWTGRSSSGWPRTAGAGTGGPAPAGSRRR